MKNKPQTLHLSLTVPLNRNTARVIAALRAAAAPEAKKPRR